MKTPPAFFLAVTLCISIFCPSALGQNQTADGVRIERLTGLAKVWGTIKYFHPFLGDRDIDWDKALVETIPKVNAAKTSQQYQAAVNDMLAALNDKSTYAEIETEAKPIAESTSSGVKPVRTENRVLIIDVVQIANKLGQNESAMGGFIESVNQALPNVSGVVIDARGSRKLEGLASDGLLFFMRQIVPALLDRTVVLGSVRYRMHNGYASQTSRGSGDYYSAFVTSAPNVIVGKAKTKSFPIAFIINQNSPALTDILSGMQSAKLAFVIQEGEQAPDSDSGAFTIDLPEKIKVRMRTVELVNPNGSIGLQADTIVPKTPGSDATMSEAMRAVQENRISQGSKQTTQMFASQISQKDKTYADMQFPAVEYRLLALFRFWNVINHFYPYKKLIEDTWETVLPRFIPKFEADKDAADYQLTVRELVTEIHDSHGGVGNADAAQEKLGTFQPPVVLAQVENRSVVIKVLDEKLPIKVGDALLNVDGEPVEKRGELLTRYFASSTPQWAMKIVNFGLLIGQKDSVAKVRVRAPGGEVREVTLTRSMSIMDPKLEEGVARSSPMIQVLPSGFGYVDLARLQIGDVNKMFETMKNTPAVIFDMRGYPNGTAWPIAPRLTEKKNVVAALFSRQFLEATNLNGMDWADDIRFSFGQKLPEAEGDLYKGKVVMLINEDAISSAEHTCLFFESATDVTFIGTPTAGANGDVTAMVLPGNLLVGFTGQAVRHADGRQLQRVGIQPNIRVAPTIGGIVEGRDEVLEAAVKYLKESLKK